MSIFKNKSEVKPSMRRRLVFSLGSLAAILLLSGIISIMEYRRMSDYVSELIASNIKSINLSQRLSDMTQEYDIQMLEAVGVGVAMANSVPEVLAVADMVAPSNDEDGVAKVIEEYVLV